MTLNPKKSPFVFSLLFALAALLAASVLPIWQSPVRYFTMMLQMDGSDPVYMGYPDSYGVIWNDLKEWIYLVRHSWELRTILIPRLLFNLRTAVIAITAGAVVGRLIYWLIWEKNWEKVK